MSRRQFVPFDDLWSMRIDVPVSLLVRDGDLAWSCGQCPLDGAGAVRTPDDPVVQSRLVCDSIVEVLRRGGLVPGAVGKLLVYHCAAEAGDVECLSAVFRECFGPDPLILPLAVPHFYYPGMCVEVDVFASTAGPRRSDHRDPASGLAIGLADGGELAWAIFRPGAQDTAAALDALEALLDGCGLSTRDLLSDRWLIPAAAGHAEAEAQLESFLRAGLLGDPGAAVTVAVPDRAGLTAELTFARGRPRGGIRTVCDSAIMLCTRRSGGFLWAAARSIDPRLGLVGQTEAVMETLAQALAGHGAGFGDVVKSTTHYLGAPTPEDLHRNLAVRNRYYRAPGPASTGVPVQGLADPRSLIAVDLTVRLDEAALVAPT